MDSFDSVSLRACTADMSDCRAEAMILHIREAP
jgi:hypothetical protein